MTFPANVGNDVFLFLDGKGTATVRRVDPDTGVAAATSTGVPYASPDYKLGTQPAGDGEVGFTQNSFFVLASGVSFVPRARDTIETEDGNVWEIGDVDVIAFGSLYQCPGCVLRRG